MLDLLNFLYYFQYSLFIPNFFLIKITKFQTEEVLEIHNLLWVEFCLDVKEVFCGFQWSECWIFDLELGASGHGYWCLFLGSLYLHFVL